MQPIPANTTPTGTGNASRVLLVEDDALTREVLGAALTGQGYQMHTEPDGAHVEGVLRAFHPDIALIDLHLGEGLDGIGVARRLRAGNDLPILFVTAASGLEERLEAFAAGGDDYLVKPFSMHELVARMQAILRRSRRTEPRTWRVGDIVLDEDQHMATRAGREINLTKLDFELLLTFCQHRGSVLSKTQLLNQVWGFEYYDPNVVEVHVSSLRRKIEEHGDRIIHTIRGVGYVLRPSPRDDMIPARSSRTNEEPATSGAS